MGKNARRDTYERRAVRNKIIIIVMAVLMALSLLAVPLSQLLASRDTGPPDPGGFGPYDRPFDMTIDVAADYRATVRTQFGDIVIALDPQGAPVATNNFINLANDGYYDGVVIHRVIRGFVVQTGDPTGTGGGGPGYRFDDELDTATELVEEHGGYTRGTVAMANAGPDTNGSQFFIVQSEVVPLAPAYTVFGRVVDGIDVVDQIARVAVDASDRPLEPITIRVTIAP